LKDSFLLTFAMVLERGLSTNSYKFVLARSLADDRLPDERRIPAEWLARRFLEAYWPLATQYRIRQSTDVSREPVAYKWAAELAAHLNIESGQSLQSVQAAFPDRFERLIARLAAGGGCLDEVVPRFHVVRGVRAAFPLFEPAEDGRSLLLLPHAHEWLALHRVPIRQMANGAWVRFTESFSASPRLYAKLAGARKRRKSLLGHRLALARIDQTCFYCGCTDPRLLEVDHFLPWSFVLEDRLWNLVLACGGAQGCNQRKKDSIPNDLDTERLIKRNETYFVTPSRRDPSNCHPHLREWIHRDLEMHVRQLRATALFEGFPNWVRTGLD
jgi:hypothetical protein